MQSLRFYSKPEINHCQPDDSSMTPVGGLELGALRLLE